MVFAHVRHYTRGDTRMCHEHANCKGRRLKIQRNPPGNRLFSLPPFLQLVTHLQLGREGGVQAPGLFCPVLHDGFQPAQGRAGLRMRHGNTLNSVRQCVDLNAIGLHLSRPTAINQILLIGLKRLHSHLLRPVRDGGKSANGYLCPTTYTLHRTPPE